LDARQRAKDAFEREWTRRASRLDECERAEKLKRGAFKGGFWVDQGHRVKAGLKGERRLGWHASAGKVVRRMETFVSASQTEDLRVGGKTERQKGRKKAMLFLGLG